VDIQDSLLGFHATAHDPFRVVLALPLLRLLTSIDSLRVKVLGLVYTLPLHSDVAVQLLCIFYAYGAVGVLLFARIYSLSPGYQQLGQTVFDSFLQSLLSLYQLTLANNWTYTMESSLITVASNILFVLYFMSFILLCALLFSSLLSGVVMVALSAVLETHAKCGPQPTTFDLMDTLRSSVRSVADEVASEVRWLVVCVAFSLVCVDVSCLASCDCCHPHKERWLDSYTQITQRAHLHFF
jgi:hypothetical protein